jgi:hypothetical protein
LQHTGSNVRFDQAVKKILQDLGRELDSARAAVWQLEDEAASSNGVRDARKLRTQLPLGMRPSGILPAAGSPGILNSMTVRHALGRDLGLR